MIPSTVAIGRCAILILVSHVLLFRRFGRRICLSLQDVVAVAAELGMLDTRTSRLACIQYSVLGPSR